MSCLQDLNLLYTAKVQVDKTGKQNSWTKETLTPENIDNYIIRYLGFVLDTEVRAFIESNGSLH